MRSHFLTRSAFAAALLLSQACGNSSGPGITLDVIPASVQLVRNDTVRLAVNALDGDGHLVTGVAVSFASNDTTIVTVSNLGTVRSRALLGQTLVRVRGGGVFTDVPVTVTGTPSGIIVAPADTTIRTTGTIQFRATVLDEVGDTIRGVSVTWRSEDTTLATISSTGLATAKSRAGATYIVALYGGRGGSAILRVAQPGVATHVTVSPPDTAIASGATVQLTATARDGLGDSVPSGSFQWSSTDSAKATVSSSGLVHSVGPSGDVTIIATSGTVSGTALVTVLDSMVVARTRLPGRPQGAAIFGNIAYVTQLDLARISRANLPSHAFTTSVTVGSIPTGIVFNSTGSRAYVTNQYGASVSIVNPATNTVVDSIVVGNRPFEVLVAPGDSLLYVAKIDSVYGIRLSTKAIIARFAIPDAGNGMAIARDTLLYVSTHNGGTVVEFNLRTRTLGRTLAVGGVPQKLVVSPNGNELYIANEAGYVQFWDLDTGLQIGSNLALPSAGYGMARRPSNGLLYVTSAYYGGGYIHVIDPVSRTLVHSAVLGGATRHVVFSADGSGLVANENGWVDFLK
jgi:YVTN family beta-propeller protein